MLSPSFKKGLYKAISVTAACLSAPLLAGGGLAAIVNANPLAPQIVPHMLAYGLLAGGGALLGAAGVCAYKGRGKPPGTEPRLPVPAAPAGRPSRAPVPSRGIARVFTAQAPRPAAVGAFPAPGGKGEEGRPFFVAGCPKDGSSLKA